MRKFLRTPAGKPDLIALTEAHNADGRCRRWGKRHGYEVLGEQTDVTVMVHKGLLEEARSVPMSEWWWWGPHRGDLRRRRPRTHLYVQMSGVPVLCVHNPPGGPEGGVPRTGGKNKAAWHESAAVERTHLSDRGGLVIGDLNAFPAEVREHIWPKYAPTSRADGVAYNGFRHTATHRIPDGGRRHGWGLVTLERTDP